MGTRRQDGRLAAEQLLDALRAVGVFVAAMVEGSRGRWKERVRLWFTDSPGGSPDLRQDIRAVFRRNEGGA
jgi:hypothetical protein